MPTVSVCVDHGRSGGSRFVSARVQKVWWVIFKSVWECFVEVEYFRRSAKDRDSFDVLMFVGRARESKVPRSGGCRVVSARVQKVW